MLKVFAPAFYNDRKARQDRWCIVPCEFAVRTVDARDAPVAATAVTKTSTGGDSSRTDIVDYRIFEGNIWEPAYKNRYVWSPGTLVEARSDSLSRILELIVREKDDWYADHRNILALWPFVPFCFDEGKRWINRSMKAGGLNVDENPVSPKASAAVLAAEKIASRTIAIDGAPWRRSLGPFLDVSGPTARWVSPAVSGIGNHQLSSTALTHAVLPQWRERVEAAIQDGIGGAPLFEETQLDHAVEILDPEALRDAFDAEAMGLDIMARHALCRIRRLRLPRLTPHQVSALAELRQAVIARLPQTRVFRVSKWGLLGLLQIPEVWSDLPPSDDLLDKLGRCHEAIPGRRGTRTFHRMRAIREFLAAEVPECSPVDDGELDAIRF